MLEGRPRISGSSVLLMVSSTVSPMADVTRMGIGNAPCQSPFVCMEGTQSTVCLCSTGDILGARAAPFGRCGRPTRRCLNVG